METNINTKYQHGDYALYKGELCQIVNNCGKLLVKVCDNIGEVSMEDVMPIRITPQLLTAMGLEIVPFYNLHNIRLSDDTIIEYRKMFRELNVSSSNGINVHYKNCVYLHQMQQVLRLCGKQDFIKINDVKNNLYIW